MGFISVLVNQPNPLGRNLWERMRPYIGFVGVSGEHRNSGIGKALIAEAARRALLVTGKSHIYLECEDDNESAQRLYEKTGFKILPAEEVEKTFGRPPHLNSRVYRAERQLFGL
jgi:ribosomal protein S18 acetylase RimI-like enzyme